MIHRAVQFLRRRWVTSFPLTHPGADVRQILGLPGDVGGRVRRRRLVVVRTP